MNVFRILITLAPILSINVSRSQEIRAFPDAEGFGAQSIGGRGGRIIEVTNLNDDGPGSLRQAVEADGKRNIVFRIGGTIELKTELVLTKPFVTVAGQTAPGGGITVRAHPENPRSTLTIKGGAHDVIVRHVRFRPGPSTRRDNPKDDSHIQDAVQILDASRVIVDHCSCSWATDEVVSTFNSARDVTIQWCLISEALRNTKRGGPDGKGLLLGGPNAERISAHHNLLVHNIGRNPMVKAAGIVDLVNNVVLAPATTAISVDGEYGTSPVNVVGNLVIAPNSDGLAHGLQVLSQRPVSVFVQGNFGPFRVKPQQPEELFVNPNHSRQKMSPTRHAAPAITTLPAADALEQLLAKAGCTVPQRDDVDLRIVDDVRRRNCRLIEDPAEVGGWPTLAAGSPLLDSDHDGMPDDWERQHQLNPTDPADGALDRDRDGYSNLEEYLNSIAA